MKRPVVCTATEESTGLRVKRLMIGGGKVCHICCYSLYRERERVDL